MPRAKTKEQARLKRHGRIKLRIAGSASRPRLVVQRSLKHLYATLIDDAKQKILFSLSSLDKEIRPKFPVAANTKAAEFFGEVFAKRAQEKGFSQLVFDRAGYLYHGRIKAFAQGLRKGGLKF